MDGFCSSIRVDFERRPVLSSTRLPDCDRLVGRDALRADIAGEVDQNVSVRIGLIQRKAPRVILLAVTYRDLFADVGETDQLLSGGIPSQREEIELVRAKYIPPPCAHAAKPQGRAAVAALLRRAKTPRITQPKCVPP